MVSDTDVSTEAESTEEETSAMGEAPSYGAESAPEAQAQKVEAKPKAKGGGRRAALRIIREGVDAISKDIANLKKAHEANEKRLEKQVSSLRSEVASLKSHISKESVAARKKQEAFLSKILAKVSTKPKPAAKPKKVAKKGKGKK